MVQKELPARIEDLEKHVALLEQAQTRVLVRLEELLTLVAQLLAHEGATTARERMGDPWRSTLNEALDQVHRLQTEISALEDSLLNAEAFDWETRSNEAESDTSQSS